MTKDTDAKNMILVSTLFVSVFMYVCICISVIFDLEYEFLIRRARSDVEFEFCCKLITFF